jgi:hypothetical protein
LGCRDADWQEYEANQIAERIDERCNPPPSASLPISQRLAPHPLLSGNAQALVLR